MSILTQTKPNVTPTTSVPKLSAIWICTAKDPHLQKTVEQYVETLSSLPYHCELIVVGNGGAHRVAAKLNETLRAAEIPTRIVLLRRISDESLTIHAGLRASRGEFIALLPEYLQTDPNDVSRLLEDLENGSEYVASWRSPRVDSRWSAFKSTVFNRITQCLTGVKLHDINSSLRVMKREVAESVPIYGDLARFLPILAAMQGYRISEVKTQHLEERIGRGDYRLRVYIRRILDLLTLFFLLDFTRKPLRFFGLPGSFTLMLGTVTLVTVTIQKLMGTGLSDRPALVFGAILVVLGIQLFSLGLLGELIIFTHGRKMRDNHVETIL